MCVALGHLKNNALKAPWNHDEPQLYKLIQYTLKVMHVLPWCSQGERDWRRSHSFLFTDTLSYSCTKALCFGPCSECWKLSDVPVFAEGSRQGSTVTLRAGMGLLCAAPQRQSWSEPGGVQWCCWERKNEHSEKWMAQHPQKYWVFQAMQLCMEYGAIAVNGNRAKAMTVTHIMCFLLLLSQHLCGWGAGFYVLLLGNIAHF